MESLRDIKEVLVTVFLGSLGFYMAIPTITDVTMEAVCPGKDECSLAIYLTAFQQAITGIGAAVLTPLIGTLSDKYGRKTLITLPILLSIFPSAILAYSRTVNFFYVYYVLKTLTGMVSDGAIISLALAYAADKISEGGRISAFGIVSGVISASFLCGNLAARFLPISATFQVATFASLLAVVYVRVFLDESIPIPEDESIRPLLKLELSDGDGTVPELSTRSFNVISYVRDWISLIHKSSTLLKAMCVSFLASLALGGLQASQMYFLKARFHFNKNQFADLMVIVGVFGTIAQLIVTPSLSTAIGEIRLLSIGLFIGFSHLFIYSISWSVWVPYAITTFALFSFCMNPCISSIVSKQVMPNEQGKAQGCLSSIQSLANILSPLAFSPLTALFLSDDAPFYFPGFSICCLGLLLLVAFVVSLMIKVNPQISIRGSDHEQAV